MEDTITIRPPAIDEFADVVSCFAETRGPRHYSAEFYDPVWLASSRELYAAFDVNGRMAGVIGVSKGLFNEEQTTGCMLTVRPDYARRGIANALVGHVISLLRERGLRAVKGRAATGHIGAQTIVEHYGWIPTGFLYGVLEKRNASSGSVGKNALVLYTGRLSAQDAGSLYIHGECVGLARRMYAGLGVKADFRPGGGCGQTVLNAYTDAHNRVLYMQAAGCGADVAAAIGRLRERNKEMTSITVALNLGVPSAVYGYEALREAGYCFCGFDPIGQYEHAILYSGEKPQDMELTAAASEWKGEVDRI